MNVIRFTQRRRCAAKAQRCVDAGAVPRQPTAALEHAAPPIHSRRREAPRQPAAPEERRHRGVELLRGDLFTAGRREEALLAPKARARRRGDPGSSEPISTRALARVAFSTTSGGSSSSVDGQRSIAA